jgi:hypothetical protein
MKPSRTPTWARLRVHFGLLLLGLFVLGGLLVYAPSLSDPTTGQGRVNLLILRFEVMTLAVVAAVLARVLGKRLGDD